MQSRIDELSRLLVESQQQQAEILESLSEAFFALDEELRVTYFNPAAERALQRSRQEVLGRPLFDSFPAARGTIFEQTYRRVLETRQPASFEAYYPHPPQDNWYEVRANPFNSGVAVFFTIITERKNQQAEREALIHDLNERVKELRCLFQVSDLLRTEDDIDAICQQIACLVPPAWQWPERTCARVALDGTEYPCPNPFCDGQAICSDILVSGRAVGRLEVRCRPPEGHEGEPFLDEERQLLETIARTLGETLERQQAQRDLQASESRYRRIVETANEGILTVDCEFRITYANRKMGEMLGMRPDQLLGRPFLELIPEDDREDQEAILRRRMAGEASQYERRFRHADGTVSTFLVSGTPLTDSAGEVVASFAMFSDITERKQAERERLRLESQIQHAQKLESLGLLAGGIAHDFNNLMVAILGNADLALSDMSPTSTGRENLEAIRNTALRAVDLTNQMLAYSGKGRFVIQAVDLNELVDDMAHLLEVSIAKNCNLRFDFAESLPSIEVDVSQLRQVVMNLITNASDAVGSKRGIITISTGHQTVDAHYLQGGVGPERLPDGQYVFLEVSDTGCGMDPSTQDRLFDPFFSTKAPGRGLGMAAVLGIVRGHKGTIRVYSEKGKGTSFKVLFPASDRPAQPRSSAADATGAAWTPEGKVLVVDDEPAVRQIAESMLQRIGFDVVTAASGPEALELVQSQDGTITAVLLDMTMPEMTGEECFRELRRLRPGITVVLTSGYNEQDATNRFAGKGLAGFIQKPFTLEGLRLTFQDALSD